MQDKPSKANVPNPAAWLGRIWDRMPDSSNEAALKSWQHAFGLTDHDARVFEAVGCFVDMADRTEKAIRAIRGLPPSIIHQMLGWTAALSELTHLTAANSAWSNIRIRFTPVRRDQLLLCEKLLNEQMLTASESSEALEALLKTVNEMRAEVQSAEFDQDFRELLFDILESLHRALSEYEIRGAKGVFASMGEVLALLTRYQLDIETAESKTMMRRVWDLTTKVATVASTIDGVRTIYTLGSAGYSLLLGPNDAMESIARAMYVAGRVAD